MSYHSGRREDRGHDRGSQRPDREGRSGVCYDWGRGRCAYGDECRYAHEGPGGTAPRGAGAPGQGLDSEVLMERRKKREQLHRVGLVQEGGVGLVQEKG